MSHPSLTVTYGRIHDALRAVALQHDTAPLIVRVLVALHDRGGRADADDLLEDLCDVERELLEDAVRKDLTDRKLVTLDGSIVVAGARLVRALQLTDAGQAIADELFAQLEPVDLGPAA